MLRCAGCRCPGVPFRCPDRRVSLRPGIPRVGSRAILSSATGRKSKIPPPSLLIRTIVSFRSSRRAASRALEVIGERNVADEEHHRIATRRGRAKRAGDGAVDPVGAAVAQHPRRIRPHRPEGLDVAYRHRGRHEQRRLLGQQHAELGGYRRLAAAARRRARPRSPRRPTRRRCASSPASQGQARSSLRACP